MGYVIVGGAAALSLLALAPARLDAAEAEACQMAGAWSATYIWQGGESRGPLAFTVRGSAFVGRTVGDEDGHQGAETIRGRIEQGEIRQVQVFHSRRGWVSAHASADHTCSTITIDLPDARVLLRR